MKFNISGLDWSENKYYNQYDGLKSSFVTTVGFRSVQFNLLRRLNLNLIFDQCRIYIRLLNTTE